MPQETSERTKLVMKVNGQISIWADSRQYIIRVEGQKPWYLDTLADCFREIFDHLCKEKLANGKDKDMKEVAGIINKTRREIWEIISPLENIDLGMPRKERVASEKALQ